MFFGLKLVLGLVILVAAARALPVADFAIFSQLLVLLAFLVTLATGGVQHGMIRQVAVSQQDGDAGFHSTIKAGLIIWAVVGTVLIFVIAMLAHRLSVLLIGTDDGGWVIPWLAVLAVGTGLGTLLCAILTGQGRPVASLASQALGLVIATGIALYFLVAGQPIAAAAGFAAGPLLTTIGAALFVGRPVFESIRLGRDLRAAVSQLLGFSFAFLVTAALMPLTLLALRAIYRESFGLELLGYWLAANRISDVNTQLLGLYLTQEYLPKAAAAGDRTARRALVVRSFGVATAAMLVGLGAFSAAPELLITLLLSAKFVSAASLMQWYFLGDVLRVTSSLATFTALAHRRLILYVSIEAVAAGTLATAVVALTALGFQDGPGIAYAATYAIIAATTAVYCWRTGFFGTKDGLR